MEPFCQVASQGSRRPCVWVWLSNIWTFSLALTLIKQHMTQGLTLKRFFYWFPHLCREGPRKKSIILMLHIAKQKSQNLSFCPKHVQLKKLIINFLAPCILLASVIALHLMSQTVLKILLSGLSILSPHLSVWFTRQSAHKYYSLEDHHWIP